jgi:hypothetical protein
MNHAGPSRRTVPIVLLAAVALALAAVAPASQPVRAESGGRYATLAAKWWTWELGFPFDSDPSRDPTGALCNQRQQGQTWFLAGTEGGDATRACTAPAGTKLFFPVVNSFDAEAPAAFQRQLQAHRILAAQFLKQFDPATDLTATVDGTPAPIVRARSALFSFQLPADNIFGDPTLAGHYVGTADGYWVLLDPLPPGTHVIHFAAVGDTFSLDVVYTLTIA